MSTVGGVQYRGGSIDNQSRGNNKQSGYVQIHKRAEKIVECIIDEFC